MADGYGLWQPLSLEQAVALFRDAPFRWWVSGGHALELHAARSWRDHDDLDVSFCRVDAPLVRSLLTDWDIHIAAAGLLSPWFGQTLSAAAHQNNLWTRDRTNGSWRLDLTISEGNEREWIFRRDPEIRQRWSDAVLHSKPTGIPYLAPHLQLLFKAKGRRRKDDIDAAEVIPILSEAQADFLFAALPPNDPWTEHRK